MKNLIAVMLVFSAGTVGANEGSLQGNWKTEDSNSVQYLHIDGNKVAICDSDIKSNAKTELLGNQLGDYDYGGGDELTVSGNELIRTGEDHGEIYQTKYEKVNSLPQWCLDLINE